MNAFLSAFLFGQKGPDDVRQFFEAVEQGNGELVRSMLQDNKQLAQVKCKCDSAQQYDQQSEVDAVTFLGAYVGSVTALQLAIMKQQESVALDIIDATLDRQQLDITYGTGNTALHLATFYGQRELVQRLLEQGADAQLKNAKGFRSMDLVDVDDEDMKMCFQ